MENPIKDFPLVSLVLMRHKYPYGVVLSVSSQAEEF